MWLLPVSFRRSAATKPSRSPSNPCSYRTPSPPQTLLQKLSEEKVSNSKLTEQLESRGDVEKKLGESMRANAEMAENLSALQSSFEQLVRVRV